MMEKKAIFNKALLFFFFLISLTLTLPHARMNALEFIQGNERNVALFVTLNKTTAL